MPLKRIAILTVGEAPVATQMMETLNRGNRYRVGKVPADIAGESPEAIADALRGEGVDMLIVEDFGRELPGDFPVQVMTIQSGETAGEAIGRLMRDYPDYSTERQWAQVLGEKFEERPASPPPMPGAVPEPPQYNSAPHPQHYNPGPQPPQYGQTPAPGTQNSEPMPDTCLLWSILATIFCCMAAGIVAIVFSVMVSSRYYGGDYEGARKASRTAQIWVIVSIVLGCVSNALYVPWMLMSNML